MSPKIAAYIAVGLISAVIFLAGLQLPTLWSRVISAVPLIVSSLFAVFDKWVWKWAFVPKLVQRPVLHGTWHGHISSSWNPETKYEAFLAITQTFTTIQVLLITAESKSRSVIAAVVTNSSDDFSVFYHYGNTPKPELRVDSPIHMGGVSVEAFGVRPSEIEGEYWTSRNSGGSMDFSRISGERIGSFIEGKKLQQKSEKS